LVCIVHMDENNADLFANCQFNEPVTEEAVTAAEAQLGMQLPDEYLRLLVFSDGLQGQLGDSQVYITIWPAEDLKANNDAYNAPQLIPGILLIGTTGNNEGICIDMRESSQTSGSFFMVALDPLDWDDAESLGSILEEAFEKLKNPFNLPPEGQNGAGMPPPLSQQ
jgi:hypothetical protein